MIKKDRYLDGVLFEFSFYLFQLSTYSHIFGGFVRWI